MTDDKFLLLKMHGYSEGLSAEVVREIADECELIKCDSGEYLHRANQPFNSVYLVIYGRIQQTLIDIQGNVMLQRFQTAGAQIGGLAAALGEPSPIDLMATEPTTLLRLDYQTVLDLTKKHEVFQQNFSRGIAESVQNLLMKDRRQKRPALVAIFHQSPTSRPLTPKLIKRLKELGENPCVLSDQTDWQPIDDVPYYCLKQADGYVSPEEIRKQVDLWANAQRAFVDVDASIDLNRASNIVEVCEKTFWCVTPENWRESVERLEAIQARAPGWRDKVNVVWLLPGNYPWCPLAHELKPLAKRSFQLSFDEPPKHQSRELVNGIERIVHQLRGIRIGVALGGGAARGMAHLGVLKVLEQNGIIIDMIAGTSAGAMTGILYASGMEPDYNAKCFVKDLKPSWLFRHLPNGNAWYLLYKYRRRQFDPMLRTYLKDSRLEQLPIPVHSITVDLVSGQPVVRDEGDCVHAITESINLPVLAIPINRDGRALVDGGIINNVPANVLVSNGCNFVIAVSVTARLEQRFASNSPDTPTSQMKSASAIQTMLRTYVVQNVNMNSVGVAPADLVIQPDVTGFDVTEFSRADEMAEIGAKSALESIPKIRELLAQVDDRLFVGN